MTIAFLQLDQDCQALPPGLVMAETQCQDCQIPPIPLPLLNSQLDQLCQLQHHQIPLAASVILLNGAWDFYRTSLAGAWDQFQGLQSEQLTHLPWQRAAQLFQGHWLELPLLELDSLMQVLQAWDCDFLRLIPYLSHPHLQPPLPLERFPGLVIGREQLGTGLRQIFGDLFQASALIQWQQQQLNPLELGLEVLIQPVVACMAAGSATFISGVWHITAVPGLPDGETRMTPDRYELEANTFKLQQVHLGQKDYRYTLTPGLGLTITPLSTAVSQELTLSQQHLENLQQLFQAIPFSVESTQLRYGWQIPTETDRAEIHRLSTPNPEYVPTSYQLQRQPLATGIIATPGQALAPALVIRADRPVPDFGGQQPGYILVVTSFNPEWLPGLRGAAGLVCEGGGLASHGAILARELGLPAVIGVTGATQIIQSGDVIYLDGQTGQVAQVIEINPIESPSRAAPPLLPSSSPKPTSASAPTGRTQLYVNLSQAKALPKLATLPIAGIGLLRSENIFLEQLGGQHPALWFAENRQAQLQERYRHSLVPFFAAFAPRPIFYRSLDLRSHELRGLVGGHDYEPHEGNPVLGLRGLARSCLHPELFQLELATLQQMRQRYPNPIRFVLPFVRSCEEVAFACEQLHQAGLLNPPDSSDFEVWVMAEVPGILFLLPELPGLGVKGISIGSNDLTQLLLGVDREQSALSQHFNETHPAVKAAITQLIRMAQNLGLACSLCGEAVSVYPDWVEWLAGLGIDGISVTPEALSTTGEILHRYQPDPLIPSTTT